MEVALVESAAKLVMKAASDMWSETDVMSDKPKPSEYLGEKGVSSMQGLVEKAVHAATSG